MASAIEKGLYYYLSSDVRVSVSKTFFYALFAALMAFVLMIPDAALAAPAPSVQTFTAQEVALTKIPRIASGSVTIRTHKNTQIAKGKTLRIKPKFTVRGKLKIVSKRLTVTRAGKVIARNRTSVALKPGQYRVRTTLKYRVKGSSGWSSVKTKSKTRSLTIKQIAAKPKAKPKAKPTATYYKNCSEARADGAAPVYRGDPGYGTHLDRDRDGIGCE